jgi:hypothetical protein
MAHGSSSRAPLRSLSANLIDCEYDGCLERASAHVRWTRDERSPAALCLEHRALVLRTQGASFAGGYDIRQSSGRDGRATIQLARLGSGPRMVRRA